MSGVVSLRVTGSPLKQMVSLELANALQKSVLDCHRSESLEALVFIGAPAWPCNEGANREPDMEMFRHVSHVSEQKSFVELAELVLLQRIGTDS